MSEVNIVHLINWIIDSDGDMQDLHSVEGIIQTR